MQRCLKNKSGQTPSLALIVAVMGGQTHHHTSVISTSSIFSAGLRWFCVGGGGAARTGRSLPYEVSGVCLGACENPGDSAWKLFSLAEGERGKYWELLLSGLGYGLPGGWSYSGSGGREPGGLEEGEI